MPIEAKFTGLSRFIEQKNGGNAVEVYLFLSMGRNRKGENLQTDEGLLSFIQMVNRNRILQTATKGQTRIALLKIKIVLSGEGLFEAYVGKELAKYADETWMKKQADLLLKNLAPEFGFDPTKDVMNWKMVIDNPLYDRALADIQDLYSKDRVLQDIISKLIIEHKYSYKIEPKNDEAAAQAVKEYVFKESAAFLCWGKVVCYPSPSFNPASQYILEQLTGQGDPPYPGALYLGYEFRTIPAPAPALTSTPIASASSSGRITPPSPKSTKLPFFNQGQVFEGKLIAEQENHVWKVSGEVRFNYKAIDEATQYLLAHIKTAKENYTKGKDGLPHPFILPYNQELVGFAISYRIELLDNTVIAKINPFDVLIEAIKHQYDQQKAWMQQQAEQLQPPLNII